MQQKLIKVISGLLVTTILYANSAAVISYAADNFLSEKEIESQGTSTNDENVEFDVYYDGGNHSAALNINSTDTKLNIAVNVKNAGYLKDASVDLSDSNFTIAQTEESENIQAFDAEGKKLIFNQINNGVSVVESITIVADKKDEIEQDMFSKDNTIKFTATYINAKAEEVAIEKNIVIHTDWQAEEAKANLQYEITKYIPYATNDVSKIITQGKITSAVENSTLPIKETNIEIIAPTINNEYPEEVTVIANSTNATNGDVNGEKFTTDNWSYDNSTGKILINVKNDVADGKIKWSKNTNDEYIVTYIYSSEVYEAVKDSVVRITYEASSEMSLYGNGVTGVNATVNGYQDQNEKLGEIIEFTSETTSNISKGYMYNNKNTADENKKETEYTTKYTANISYVDVIDVLTLQQGIDQFVTENGTEKATTISSSNYAYNKTLKISKQEFDKVFGQTGTIEILNSEGTVLVTINKDTTAENDTIIIDLVGYNLNNLTIKTSKPEKEGNITFEITKAIAKDIDYSTSQIKSFASLKTSMVGTAKNGDTNIVNSEKTNYITLDETTQKVGITTNNNRLSTIVNNENIEIKVTLENDSADDTMYKNPTIKVDLPTNIETLNVKTAQLFFDDELTITQVDVIDNGNGTKSIIASLQGTQTKYNNSAVKGATIIFTVDITLNKLTPTTTNTIYVSAANDGAVSLTTSDENGTVATSQTEIQYVAPTGLVATNSMTGYNGDEVLEVISGEAKEVLISTQAEAKEVTFTMNVINNYENTLDNVVVLGRTPFEGNKDISTSQSLGSTMTMPLTTGITVNGIEAEITIYYSENGEATSDLSNSSNGWTTSINDYSNVKSYMIVLNNYTMNTGETFTFSYKATIPANLDYDNAAYENYIVYFNNNQESGTISDKVVATKIGVTTGSIAKLDANLTSKTGESVVVNYKENLEYTLTINNTGALDAENVTINIDLPSKLTYVAEADEQYQTGFATIIDEEGNEDIDYSKLVLTIQIGTIKAKTTLEKTLTLKTGIVSEDTQVQMKATIKYNDAEIETNSIINTIAAIKIITTTTTNREDNLQAGDSYQYIVSIRSSEMSVARENTIVTITLPTELKYSSISVTGRNSGVEEDITSSVSVEEKNNVITINLGSVDGVGGKILRINAIVNQLEEDIYQKEVSIKGTIQADGVDVQDLDSDTVTINKPGMKITQTCNIPEGTTISAGEDFTYTFTIENLSKIYITDIAFKDSLPEGIQFSSIEIIYTDGTTYENFSIKEGLLETTVILNPEDKVIVKVNVIAKSLDKDTKVTNNATVIYEEIGEISSNEISHTVKKFDSLDINVDPGTGENKQTKKIIGTIWVDTNKDGIKDVDEEKVSGTTVLLLDNATGDIAVSEAGENCIVTTDTQGAYMFNNLNAGKYTVIFLYNSSNYSPTEYQKDGVSESQNSDAIDKTVIYEEKTQIAAVTEEIIISTENIYDIDLGIVEDPKFDLKLDKVVKSITVNNTKTTKEHEYNSKLAKVDFESKYAASSSMVVEYKFTITNEGGISGYVKKLADYLPSEMKFSSELNNDWYEGKDGVIYNASLANTIINPGESKEVTLILTKNMNSEDFGMINNSAEIFETSNDYGVLDIDSTPGNKVSSEDDYSTANVLTSIKTGGIIIYTTLTLTVIAIIGVGIYMIKKKVLK